MKRIVFLGLMMVFAGTGLLKSEVVYLKDGSTLKGTLKKISGDTLYFEASFGSMMRIPKDKIARVDFAEVTSVISGTPPAAVGVAAASEAPGSLMVLFEKVDLSSRITVKRNRDLEGHVRENAIEMALLIDGQKVYSFIDSTTDKTIAKGPESIIRNDFKLQPFSVGLPPGIYQGSLRIGNTRADKYADRFDPKPLDQILVLDNLKIKSNETLVVRVALKKKLLGIKGAGLVRQP